MKKHKIEVRLAVPGVGCGYVVIAVIERKLWAEQSGNFNPIFCTYKGKRTLVHSTDGDLSDPFRREESYLNHLYIKHEEPKI